MYEPPFKVCLPSSLTGWCGWWSQIDLVFSVMHTYMRVTSLQHWLDHSSAKTLASYLWSPLYLTLLWMRMACGSIIWKLGSTTVYFLHSTKARCSRASPTSSENQEYHDLPAQHEFQPICWGMNILRIEFPTPLLFLPFFALSTFKHTKQVLHSFQDTSRSMQTVNKLCLQAWSIRYAKLHAPMPVIHIVSRTILFNDKAIWFSLGQTKIKWKIKVKLELN